MNKYGVCTWLVAALFSSAVAQAQVEQLEAFTGATELEQAEYPLAEQVYPAGSVRRISGNLRYSAELRGVGSKTTQTWQIAGLHSAERAFAEVRQYWRKQGAHTLYWCEGRECGASSLWANSVFNNSRLYGPDDNQAYALMLLPQDPDYQQVSVIAFYAIKRGNGRSYLHQEQMQLEHLPSDLLPEPATLLKQLNKEGELALTHLTQAPSPEWVQLLARSIKRNALLQVSLQGAYAADWQAALLAAGVRPQQLAVDANQPAPGLILKKR